MSVFKNINIFILNVFKGMIDEAKCLNIHDSSFSQAPV